MGDRPSSPGGPVRRSLPEEHPWPRIDLLGWTTDRLAQMPPTLVITDERDVLRSQGEQFARDLEAAGAETTHRHYPGVMHDFSARGPCWTRRSRPSTRPRRTSPACSAPRA
ncbi:alpha/beta hydrolase fold domain-containing protein [Blastococcus goldschmidtiae]|uniref:Alpha/beta hydrolase fold domain-containing protein n=1 Tax=Blastococcus goldschmidtiae TaxID=3075546 RepID=A0ABU2K587_9ACTN|nr:alpha/beta hydrolase fold domain-containing protein [Blastococcus sp. DSM 46792]MDT0275363.1 alpha/beta hydrolase fold domain-containing protein [Blastococcus sp. DSM 46792]